MILIFCLTLFVLPFSVVAQMACDWVYQPVCAVSRTQNHGDQIREILWTYHNSCVAQARRARIISDGVCTQPSRMVPRIVHETQSTQTPPNEQIPKSEPNIQTASMREPSKPFADYLQSSDPVLTTMRQSIVTRVEKKSLTEKVRFLITFLDTLKNQISALDQSSSTYTQLINIRTSIQTWLNDAQTGTTNTQSISQPTQTQHTPDKTQNQITQRGPVSVASNGWIRTPKGDILIGSKNGETITITFSAGSVPGASNSTQGK